MTRGSRRVMVADDWRSREMCRFGVCWLQLMLLLQQQARRHTRHGAAVCGTCATFAATRCFFYVLSQMTLCVQRPPRAGGVASWPVLPYQVNLMSLVPMLAAAYVAPAAASAATHTSWRCWRAMAMGDTPALMKELGEVVCAVICAGGSGPSCCMLHNRRRLTCRIHSRRRFHPRGVP